MQDKQFWQDIIDAECTVPEGYTVAELTKHLFAFLSVTDSELRDTYGYTIFARWVLADAYSVDDLRVLIPRLQTLLTIGIGEQNTDQVFGRSFGVLWLAMIVYYDNHRQQFMTVDETRSILNSTLAYFAQENDLRGFVKGKGWAHSCAHTADLIDELVQHRHVGVEEVLQLLDAIADKVQAPTGYIFHHEEDERMAYAVVTAFQNEQVTAETVAVWLQHFKDWTAGRARYSYADDPAWACYINIKNLLRSVYVRLNIAEDVTEPVRAHIPAVQEALKLYSLRM